MKNFGSLLESTLLPYKPFLDKIGVEIKRYEEVNRELGYIIIGVKLIFQYPNMIDRILKEGEKK